MQVIARRVAHLCALRADRSSLRRSR